MKRKHKNPINEVSPEQSLQESLNRFAPLLSAEEYSLLLDEVKKPLLTTLRVNPLKAAAGSMEDWQNRYHWQVQPIPYCETGYRVDDRDGTPVSQTVEHRLGYYYIQEAASMIPPELFDIDPADPGLTLDLAASPGGKTTHLIARGLDHGFVLANDSSQGRIPALRIVLQNWGAANSAICQFPGEKLGPWFQEVFDRALIDAPCSMQGLRTSDSHTSRPVTEKESLSLAKRQTALLTSALQAVKVGGQVVYSTCTLLPEEDEGVVDAILRRFGKSVHIVNVHTKLPVKAPGIVQNADTVYLPELEQSLRLWPHRLGTAGFFACLIEKTASLDLPTQDAPARPLSKAGFIPVPHEVEKLVSRQLMEQYGFDLAETLSEYHLSLMQRFEKVIAMPEKLLENFAQLPLEYAGLLLGELTDEGLTLSHEWVSRFGKLFKFGKVTLSQEQTEHWLRGEDCFDVLQPPVEKGRVIVVCRPDGLVIGRGKMLKDRLKNLLLRRLV